MKVSMKVQISGTRDGVMWPRIGGVLEVSDAEGSELCSQGYADPVAEAPRVLAEKAVPSKRAEKRA